MNLFRYAENFSEDENQTEAEIQKKRMRMKMNRSENDSVFKGKKLERIQGPRNSGFNGFI